MKLVVGDAKQFKQCIEAIVNLVDEGTFNVSASGLKFRSMDPSQIAMVDFTMPKEAFLEFTAPNEANVSLNLADFLKMLGRSRNDEQLIMQVEEEQSKFALEFTGPNAKRSVRLPLLDLGGNQPREPKVPFDSTVKMRGGSFKEMLKDAGLLSSHVILQVESELFTVEAKGDSGDLKVETKKDAPTMAELASNAKSRSMFPYEYMDNICKACPDDTIIEVGLKTDAPVRVSYKIGGAQLAYFLAPRVESQ